MYNCPECSKEMGWVGDNEIDHEVYITEMTCRDCHIDLIKYWGEGVDSE